MTSNALCNKGSTTFINNTQSFSTILFTGRLQISFNDIQS